MHSQLIKIIRTNRKFPEVERELWSNSKSNRAIGHKKDDNREGRIVETILARHTLEFPEF